MKPNTVALSAGMNGKPPFSIPSMKEINNLEKNGFKVISTFSGGGGSCLGYKMAGYDVIWANEFIPEAQKTYRANFSDTILDKRDIREIDPEDILKATGLKKGELDIFDGSPPCSAFSVAGRREKGWGEVKAYSDTKQRVDDLFFEYIRILEGLQPKVFIAENVPGLTKGKAKGYFKLILKALKEAGYRVKVKKLIASRLGCPQKRERLIFVGVRKDLGLEPVFPEPFSYEYTIRDAFQNLPGSNRKSAEWVFDNIKNYKIYQMITQLPINPKKAIGADEITGNSWFSLVRPSYDLPCPTITATTGCLSAASVVHPYEDRKFTIEELKRLTTIPDDFILTGGYKEQAERLGRMVPSIMMKNIAKTIEEEILCKIE